MGQALHMLRLVTIGLLVLVGSACGGLTSTEPPVDDPGGSNQATAEPPAAAPQDPPALDLWDNFGVVAGHEAGRYDSLGAIVRWSHAIVQGTVTSVQGRLSYGEDDPGLQDIQATLSIGEVFKGDLAAGDDIPVVLGLTDRGDVEQRFAELVGDEGVFFLARSGAPRPEFGLSGLPAEDRPGVWIPATSQGVVIDNGGSAVFATNIVSEGFPADIDGISMEELEKRIGELLEGRV